VLDESVVAVVRWVALVVMRTLMRAVVRTSMCLVCAGGISLGSIKHFGAEPAIYALPPVV
jgi:hypothetical protein